LAGMYRVTSKSLTSPAMCEFSADGSKRVMRPIPERPLTILSQAVATSLPTGLTMPRPVMTTRRFTDDSQNRQKKGGPEFWLTGRHDRGGLLAADAARAERRFRSSRPGSRSRTGCGANWTPRC